MAKGLTVGVGAVEGADHMNVLRIPMRAIKCARPLAVASLLLAGIAGDVVKGSTPAWAYSNTSTDDASCPHGCNSATYASDACFDGLALTYVEGTFSAPLSQNGTSSVQGDFIREKTSAYVFAPCDKGYIEAGYEWNDGSFYNPHLYYEYRTYQGAISTYVSPGRYPVKGYGELFWSSTNGWYAVATSGSTDLTTPGYETLGVSAAASGPACIGENGDFVNANEGTLANTYDFNKAYRLQATDSSGIQHATWPHYTTGNPCQHNNNPSYDCMNGAWANGNTIWQANDNK